jgi:hypothetical protein
MSKKSFRYIDNGIEVQLEESEIDGILRPIKIIIDKSIYPTPPNSEYIRKSIVNKFGFSISYNEYFNSTDFKWETSVTSCLTAKRR